MTRSTRAAVLRQYGQPPMIEEVEVPDLVPGAVLVRVAASTVCGTDVHIADGHLSFASTLPVILGHEIIGEIQSSARDTDALGEPLRPGDRVAWAYAWCGRCYWCTVAKEPTLCPDARRYGWGPADRFPYLTGGFAEHAYVLPGSAIVKVPDGIAIGLAASATCSLRTVFHALERLGGIRLGESVVVQGSGPVGLWATAVAVRSGAGRVITLGAPADRLDLARRLGAEVVVDVTTTASAQRRAVVLDATSGRGADVVLECSGALSALGEGMELARMGGRMACIGQSSSAAASVPGATMVSSQLTVLGVKSGDVSHYYQAFRFLADHGTDPDLSSLVGRRHGLGDVGVALEAMRTMQDLKPMVVPGDDP